jgi:hypothetical protein
VNVAQVLKDSMENHESETVSDAFGGARSEGRTPSFSVPSIADKARTAFAAHPNDPASLAYMRASTGMDERESKHLLQAAIRFAFLIELTNLAITSTKMKTRWVTGKITKVAPGSFTNVAGDFSVTADERAATFDECFEIFVHVLDVLSQAASSAHLRLVRDLATGASRSVAYEFVFTYVDAKAAKPHVASNVRLASIHDLDWLVKARPIFSEILSGKSYEKIEVKSFLTDRSQTGADQTNRAKRWEVLSADFQHATLEECWSVQRKLLESLAGFSRFPTVELSRLQRLGLVPSGIDAALCPITLEQLDFDEFQRPTAHGHSAHQVGHLRPLKSGGKHRGDNVAWVTDHGNRIQGDNDINTTRQMILRIASRITASSDGALRRTILRIADGLRAVGVGAVVRAILRIADRLSASGGRALTS